MDRGSPTYLPYGPFDSYNDFSTWIRTNCVGDDPLFYAVIDLATDRAVGMAGYLRIEPRIGVIEVGHIHYSPRLKRTPAATEAMFLMMRRVFDELGYRRYEWKCDEWLPFNCDLEFPRIAEDDAKLRGGIARLTDHTICSRSASHRTVFWC